MTHHLYTEVLGEGPAVAFVPGIAATTRYFRDRVAPLASRHRLVLVDLLGFGRSPKPWTRYSVDRHVAALHEALAPHGPLTLVGHSLGARLAVSYAARYPAEVSRLVLLSLPYFGSGRAAKRYMRRKHAGYHWLWTNVVVAAVVCVVSRRLFGRMLPHMVHDLPHEVVEDSVTHTWRSSTSTLWEVLYRYDLARDVARLRPALPVGGAPARGRAGCAARPGITATMAARRRSRARRRSTGPGGRSCG